LVGWHINLCTILHATDNTTDITDTTDTTHTTDTTDTIDRLARRLHPRIDYRLRASSFGSAKWPATTIKLHQAVGSGEDTDPTALRLNFFFFARTWIIVRL
jgi:hypothetical protein